MNKLKRFLIVLTVILMFSQTLYVQATDTKNENERARDIIIKVNEVMKNVDSYSSKDNMEIDVSMDQFSLKTNYKIDYKIDFKKHLFYCKQSLDGILGQSLSLDVPIEYIEKGNLCYVNDGSGWKKIQQNKNVFGNVLKLQSEEDSLNKDMFNESNVSVSENNNQIVLQGKINTENLPDQMKNQGLEECSNINIIIKINKKNYYLDEMRLNMNVNSIENIPTSNATVNFVCTYKDYNEELNIKIPDEIEGDLENPIENHLNSAKISYDDELYEDAICNYNVVLDIDKNNIEALKGKASCYFKQQKYEEAIKELEKCINVSSNDRDALNLLAKCYLMSSKYEKAIDICDNIKKISTNNEQAYLTKIDALYMIEKYEDALKELDKLLLIDKQNESAYNSKLNLLYQLEKYDECLKTAETALKVIPDNINFLFYKVNGLSRQYKYEEAIEVCNKILKLDKENVSALDWRAHLYSVLQKYTLAKIDVEHILRLDKKNDSALQLKEQLKKDMLPTANRVKNFIEENYLYIDKVNNFGDISNVFVNKKEVTPKDVEEFVNSIRLNDDIFTFVLYGQDYEDSVSEDNAKQVTNKSLDSNTEYIKINSFGLKTGYNVQEIIKNVKKPEKKTLVLDIRDNMGGYIDSANEILDVLLPECCPSMYIDRQGYTYEYYSDDDYIKFKNIVIMTNEYTASSAELLTLSLKKYLNNVTIIGKQTFGKGVGQSIFDDKNNKFAIYLVNNHWNVKEQNIMYIGIMPDIEIETSEDKDYFDVIKTIK